MFLLGLIIGLVACSVAYGLWYLFTQKEWREVIGQKVYSTKHATRIFGGPLDCSLWLTNKGDFFVLASGFTILPKSKRGARDFLLYHINNDEKGVVDALKKYFDEDYKLELA